MYPLPLISVLFGTLNIILVFFKVGNNLLYGLTDTLAPVSILNLITFSNFSQFTVKYFIHLFCSMLVLISPKNIIFSSIFEQ